MARVVVGTRAVQDPDFVVAMACRFPEQVAVGLDARALANGTYEVAAHGWTAGTGVELFGLLSRFSDVNPGRPGFLLYPSASLTARTLMHSVSNSYILFNTHFVNVIILE